MAVKWEDYITTTPGVLRGRLHIKGTRIPARLILGYLNDKKSFDEIIKEYPDLNETHLLACQDFARHLSQWKDPIVEEVRRVRQELMEEFDNDIEKFTAYLMKQQEKHKDRLVTKEMLDKKRAEENRNLQHNSFQEKNINDASRD